MDASSPTTCPTIGVKRKCPDPSGGGRTSPQDTHFDPLLPSPPLAAAVDPPALPSAPEQIFSACTAVDPPALPSAPEQIFSAYTLRDGVQPESVFGRASYLYLNLIQVYMVNVTGLTAIDFKATPYYVTAADRLYQDKKNISSVRYFYCSRRARPNRAGLFMLY